MHQWTPTSRRSLLALAAGCAIPAWAAPTATASATAPSEIVVGQVAPLSGVLASTGEQMGLGGQIYDGLHGMTLGSRFVEVTLIGGAGKLMR